VSYEETFKKFKRFKWLNGFNVLNGSNDLNLARFETRNPKPGKI